jgi:hypothetical protein
LVEPKAHAVRAHMHAGCPEVFQIS